MDYTSMSKEELIREITALAGKVSALKENKNGFSVLIEDSADAIFISDDNGYYVEVNKKACELIGYEKSEIIGKHITDFVLKEEIEKTPLKLDEIKAGKT